jgi:hypothetical protein
MAPFLTNFPYDPKKAHFIGMPIDYIIFDDQKVVFLEIKSGKASLSQRQRLIKDLIIRKQVEWKEYRISGAVHETSNLRGQEAPDKRLQEVRDDLQPEASDPNIETGGEAPSS